MRKKVLTITTIIAALLMACTNATDENNKALTIEQKLLGQAINMETITEDTGLLMAEGFLFLNENVTVPFDVNDAVKSKFEKKRKAIFDQFIPRVKKLIEMDKNSATNSTLSAFVTFADELELANIDTEDLANRVRSVLDNLDRNTDSNLIRDIESLHRIVEILDADDMGEYDLYLLEHVGY